MEYHLREWTDTRARTKLAYRDFLETKPKPKKMIVRWDLCKPVDAAAIPPKTTTTAAVAGIVEAPVAAAAENPTTGMCNQPTLPPVLLPFDVR